MIEYEKRRIKNDRQVVRMLRKIAAGRVLCGLYTLYYMVIGSQSLYGYITLTNSETQCLHARAPGSRQRHAWPLCAPIDRAHRAGSARRQRRRTRTRADMPGQPEFVRCGRAQPEQCAKACGPPRRNAGPGTCRSKTTRARGSRTPAHAAACVGGMEGPQSAAQRRRDMFKETWSMKRAIGR